MEIAAAYWCRWKTRACQIHRSCDATASRMMVGFLTWSCHRFLYLPHWVPWEVDSQWKTNVVLALGRARILGDGNLSHMSTCWRSTIARLCDIRFNLKVGRRLGWGIGVLGTKTSARRLILRGKGTSKSGCEGRACIVHGPRVMPTRVRNVNYLKNMSSQFIICKCT